MSRYLYSIVRCLPDPRTGEFVNVGAVAGDPEEGDWAYRQLSNTERVRRFAGQSALAVALDYLLDLGEQIDRSRVALQEDQGESLPEDWLERLHHDHRNVVQFSAPAPVLASSAEEALAFVFKHMLIDPIAPTRHRTITRHVLWRQLKEAYERAHIASEFVRPHVEIHVGEKVHSPIDFAIANGRAVQLTQAWSFQLAQAEEVSMQVKAWGYALQRLRDGIDARIFDRSGNVISIDSNVDIQVMIAPPETPQQVEIFDEAKQVFDEVEARVNTVGEVEALGQRAADLAQHL